MPESSSLLVKNVENALKSAHKSRRRPGEIPYPVTYSKEMADLDIWDHMFLTSHFKSLTQHKFETQPSLALDIGCGTGFWAIEAAKQWQNSKIIGFDISHIQPRLNDMEHLRSLARRVKWTHGNFLDGLPFPSNHFDFVRMAGLGLAIPEDEWQSLLEEIHRVMKPSAVLEIIVEDLIFPSPSALIQKPKLSPSVSSPTHHLESLELFKSRSSTFSDRSNTPPSLSPISPMASLSSLTDPIKRLNRSSIFQPSLYLPGPEYHSPYPNYFSRPSPASTDSNLDSEHPQDHTRLKLSWEAMLSARFLSPKVVAIIPFYLTSSSFVDTKSYSPLVVPLPPNSGNIPSLKSYQSLGSFDHRERTASNKLFDVEFDFDLVPLSNRSNKADGCSFRSSIRYKPQAPAWGPVHMAKALSTIRGCKEAIWEEYEKLYYDDALAILLRTCPTEEEHEKQPREYLPRKAFEVDWKNWEYDMLDRTGMRDNLAMHIPWIQANSEDEWPPHLKWRKQLDPNSEDSKNSHLVTPYNPNDICRSLRVFTAFKS